MAAHRVERLNGDMQKELSALIKTLKDPRITDFLSVQRVEVTADLSYAKAYISSINGYSDAQAACAVLKNAAGYLRTRISKNLHIRKSPELTFIPDDSVENAERINKIIDGFKINEEN